jgi:AraC-like DNA-binding protein
MMRQPTDRDRKRLDRTVEHYLQYCYRKRTAARVSELAQSIHASRGYLNRLAIGTFGLTIRDLLRQHQLERAAQLLRATPLTSSEIAQASGFGTISTFHRCFTRAYGQTPAVYRAEGDKTSVPA